MFAILRSGETELMKTLSDFYRSDETKLELWDISGKCRYYIIKYQQKLGLKVTVVQGGLVLEKVVPHQEPPVFEKHFRCPDCKFTIGHPLWHEMHLQYKKCEMCHKKYPVHHLYEFGGIQDCGCNCHECMINMGCCFREEEWMICRRYCYICLHDSDCKHYRHTLKELHTCELCKDYI
jgi:hypothetical protein